MRSSLGQFVEAIRDPHPERARRSRQGGLAIVGNHAAVDSRLRRERQRAARPMGSSITTNQLSVARRDGPNSETIPENGSTAGSFAKVTTI